MAGRVLPATSDRLDDGNPQAGFEPANGRSRNRTDHVLEKADSSNAVDKED